MGTRWWRSKSSVEENIFAEPQRVDFYQAVRILEQLRPKSTPVGETSHTDTESVHFRSDTSLSFPAGAIKALVPDVEDGAAPHMTVSMIGIAGNNGPMPDHLSELINARVAKRDFALRDFLDIFIHRIVSLLVRGRRKHHAHLNVAAPCDTPLAEYVYSLCGLGTQGLKGRLPFPDRTLLKYANLLSQRPASMVGLEILARDFFGVGVSSRQFVGRWLNIDSVEWTHLGRGGQNNALGRGAMLGTRAWHQFDTFELNLGPLDYDQFKSFLPTQSAFNNLLALVRLYVGGDTEFSLRLELKGEEKPALRLNAGDVQLGWTSWLSSGAQTQNDTQVCLQLSHQTV